MPPKTSEADLAKITIGGPVRHNSEIELSEYDPTWPSTFEKEAKRIRQAVGDNTVAVEHVGSTSVPGLAAKPRIDVLLVVPDSSDEQTYVTPLEQVGYVLRIREPDWYEHRVLKGPDHDLNLHVFSDGCEEIGRMLMFRDWLRTNSEDRTLYEDTKRRLAKQTWEFVQNYADAKSEVVEQILKRAAGA